MAKPPKKPRKPHPPVISSEDAAARSRMRQEREAREGFTAGNKWWKARGRHGRLPTYPEGDDGARLLLDNLEDYFQWSEDNPLMEDKLFAYEGSVTHEDATKLSVLTIVGACVFLGITKSTWYDWKARRPDLSDVLAWAEHSMEMHNTRGASAGLLNPMIVARIHGLAERTEVTGKDGAPIASTTVTRNMTPAEAAEEYAKTREGRE